MKKEFFSKETFFCLFKILGFDSGLLVEVRRRRVGGMGWGDGQVACVEAQGVGVIQITLAIGSSSSL